MSVSDIKNKIISAFSKVKLKDGIGLWESQTIDDYEPLNIRQKTKNNDERNNWQLLTKNDLSKANSSLSFVDTKGMRFLLPAYMLVSLEQDFDYDPIFHLTQCGYDKFINFNTKQKNAVLEYLKWWSKNNPYDKPFILLAIKEFWGKQ